MGWGCGSGASLSGKKFHIKAEFAQDGTMTVSMDGAPNNKYSPFPKGSKVQLPTSKFAVSNERVTGTVKQGPEPAKCSGPAPAPAPTPPAPSPPTPSSGCCSWDNAHCGASTDYCKASQDHCEKDCNGKWIHPVVVV